MLRISKLTDYAVVLTTHLVTCDEPHSVRGLAAESGLPEATVSKVLKILAKAGIVRSQRGPGGGYQLAKEASAIPVVDVITAIEGPISVTECSVEATEGGCDYEVGCGTRANWQRINQTVHEALSSISLLEMARSAAPLIQLQPSRGAAAASIGETR
ncbi:MAG: SUF system Fe-S cluster assembly regulator [Myxococcales bacterium]|nr:SUF system Fe-S cluster assembly regulator [Myxococcales bacterium]